MESGKSIVIEWQQHKYNANLRDFASSMTAVSLLLLRGLYHVSNGHILRVGVKKCVGRIPASNLSIPSSDAITLQVLEGQWRDCVRE